MELFERTSAGLKIKSTIVARGTRLLVIAAAFSCVAVSQSDPREQLTRLCIREDGFKLRDALDGLGPTPVLTEVQLSLFRAAVEDAFNQPKAESDYQKVIANKTSLDSRHYAQLRLYALFVRSGRYREALAVSKSLLSELPPGILRDGLGSRQARDQFLAQFENQGIVPKDGHSPPPVAFRNDRHGLVLLPVNVNGLASKFLLDTGYSFCGISASEAKRLKLKISDRSSSMNAPGGRIDIYTGVARQLSVGGVTLRNVAFDVTPDSRPPYDDPEVGGIVGFPIILALKRFELDFKNSSFAVIPPAGQHRITKKSNLALAGAEVLTSVGFRGESLTFLVDLGSDQSGLHYSFGEKFPDISASGKFGQLSDGSAAGSRTTGVTFLSSPLDLIVGGRDVTIERTYISPKGYGMPRTITTGGEDGFFGTLGLAELRKANVVEFDFDTMMLSLH